MKSRKRIGKTIPLSFLEVPTGCLLVGVLICAGTMVATDAKADDRAVSAQTVASGTTMVRTGTAGQVGRSSSTPSAQSAQVEPRKELIDELREKLAAAQSPAQKVHIINEFRAKNQALLIQARNAAGMKSPASQAEAK